MSASLLACILAAVAAADVAPAIKELNEKTAAFIATLSAEQKAKAVFPFDSEKRTDWHYFPRERAGMALGECNPEQEKAALGILRGALSANGYQTVETIRLMDNVLRAMENNPKRDPAYYHFAIFGSPGVDATWAMRFEGHHLSLHWTIANGKAIASEPQFLGSNPAEVRVKAENGPPVGTRPLAFSEDIARALLKSLNEEQRKLAVIGETAAPDILSGTKREAIITEHLGVGWAQLNPEQQGMLMSIVEKYANIQRPELAQQRLERMKAAGLDKVKFAWMGGADTGAAHYYRIQGATFLFEYDNTQNNANHVHTVWRDFKGDFGADILKEHYAQSDRQHGHK